MENQENQIVKRLVSIQKYYAIAVVLWLAWVGWQIFYISSNGVRPYLLNTYASYIFVTIGAVLFGLFLRAISREVTWADKVINIFSFLALNSILYFLLYAVIGIVRFYSSCGGHC